MCGRLRVGKAFFTFAALVGAAMCPASHEGELRKLISSRFLSCVSAWRGSVFVQGGALVTAGCSLQTSHPAGEYPTTIPHSGRESSNRAAPLYRTALSHQAGQRRHPLGSACPCCSAVRAQLLGDQPAGFTIAPSGTTPCVANRHKAIRSRRAIATTITLRMRRPVPPTRSRNQLT